MGASPPLAGRQSLGTAPARACGAFLEPTKGHVAQGVCSSQGPRAGCPHEPVPVSVSCHSPRLQMAAPAALRRTVGALPRYQGGPDAGCSRPPRSSAPRQQSAGLLSEWPLLELNGSDEARPFWPGSRDTGEAGGAGARSWTRDSQAVHVLAPPLTSCVTLGSSFPAQPWLLIWEMRIIPPTASWCFRN